MGIQQPGQGTEAAEEQPGTDEEHNKEQRAAAEAEVAAYDADKRSAPSAGADHKPTQETGSAEVGVVGMAVMGSSLARNMARHGYRVALFNRTYSRTQTVVADHGSEGSFMPAETIEEFVASLERPRRIVIMVKAGKGTDATIDTLLPNLEEGRYRRRRWQRLLRGHPPTGSSAPRTRAPLSWEPVSPAVKSGL